jgi:hypothetical protein
MGAGAHALPAAPARRDGVLGSLGRALAMLLLPASIVPVLVFGPQLVRAPEKLWREDRAAVQRLAESRRPAVLHEPSPPGAKGTGAKGTGAKGRGAR